MYALQSCSRNDSQSQGGPAEDRGEEGVCVKDERCVKGGVRVTPAERPLLSADSPPPPSLSANPPSITNPPPRIFLKMPSSSHPQACYLQRDGC